MKQLRLLAAAGTAAFLLTGCSSAADEDAAGDTARMPVTAAFYPLQFAAERVGGEHVEVTSLTKPGTEPHDLELTPKAVASLADSRAVVYLAGFQPAVDDAVRSQAGDAALDVTPAADLSVLATDSDGSDPHFWLDPVRLASVATLLGVEFGERDPENAAEYRANAQALVTELTRLDDEFRTGLARCESKELVTGHTAFGYLAQRYGLGQQGIAGVSPDSEPDAAALRELSERVREAGVTTVYAETLVSPALAETVARETGATVAVLDPLEGLSDSSAGSDYLEVMRSNLATLREGQRCT